MRGRRQKRMNNFIFLVIIFTILAFLILSILYILKISKSKSEAIFIIIWCVFLIIIPEIILAYLTTTQIYIFSIFLFVLLSIYPPSRKRIKDWGRKMLEKLNNRSKK
jgi:hypothetical protein